MLSVIVTFYDETPFLRSALRSIANQGIEGVEIIVVNDNPNAFSTRDLARLTRGFDLRILHHDRNLGLSTARNTGMAAAAGGWIGFLDADDYYTTNGLADHYAYARQTGADITHAACFLGAMGGASQSVLHRDQRLHMQKRVVRGRMQAQEAQFIVSSWSSLYRADFLRDKSLRFDPAQRKFEDRLFVLNAVTAARSIAFFGGPVRVWRRRAGSISSAPTTPETHLFQVQLLEKCLAHMRAQPLPKRFEKRELFNSVSRLIWDMDILPSLARAADPAYTGHDAATYRDMGQRISAALGRESFGNSIFSDPMVAATSRVGMRTRLGTLSRTDFFAVHKALREGNFGAAQRLIAACPPQTMAAAAPITARPDHSNRRLILHIGLHKTGTTYIQHHLDAHREALRGHDVLVPQIGFAPHDQAHRRPGALSGHQGLVRALRENQDAVWQALHHEVSSSAARTVLLSAENFGFPTEPNRAALISALFERLGPFKDIQVIAMVRRPDAYVEAFYREWVTSGHPFGGQSIGAFLIDQRDNLLNFPKQFAPFEQATGHPVRLIDVDSLRAEDTLWPGFCRGAGLPDGLAVRDVPRYKTPDRDSVRAMQMLNRLSPDTTRNHIIAESYFRALPDAGADQSLLSPETRADLIAQFVARSAEFAATRGYSPDLNAMHKTMRSMDWQAPSAVNSEHLSALLDVAAQVPPAAQKHHTAATEKAKNDIYSITIRLRPWVHRLLAGGKEN